MASPNSDSTKRWAAVALFFGATIGCGLLAWLARVRLPVGDISRRISNGSIFALTLGGCVWGGLVCSPLVVFVRR